MSPITAIFYGLVQGLTEFLPVSSSGHLSILQNIFHMEGLEQNYFTFDILLHLATLIAVFIVYYKTIFPLVPAIFTTIGKVFKGKFKLCEYNENERFVIMVIVATIPLFFAVPFNDYFESLYSHTKIIGCILIFNALVLFISDMMSKGQKEISEVKPRNAIVVGLCQMCALLPGLSRSGSTITGGLTQGFSREFAVKFSFILSIPAILGANILKIPELISNPVPSSDIFAYVLGMVTAALAGIAAMKLLILISKKANFRFFSVYCAIVGLVAVIFG